MRASSFLTNISSYLKKHEYILIIFLMIVAFLVRYLLISNNNFLFFFDQSRDAYLSRQIVEQPKLKLQGPSASGTSDTIYHGVLHYYLVGPIYSFTRGDPFVPVLFLILLSTLTVIPLYYLTKSIAEGSILAAVISTTIFAFSFQAAELATWLANPSYSFFTITLFYYSLWQVFFKNNNRWLITLMLALGLSFQSHISLIYLWASIFAALYYQRKYGSGESIFKNKTRILFSILVYLVSISSMIVTQILLLYHGISPFESVINSASGSIDVTTYVSSVISGYANTIALALYPTTLTFSLVVAIVVFLLVAKLGERQKKIFFTIWLFSPLAILVVNPGITRHLLIALVPLMYILFALLLSQQTRTRGGRTIIALLLIVCLFSNGLALIKSRNSHTQFFHLQTGAFLNDALAAIDYTYEKAHNQPFTISTLTVPYSYNTTWAYLYSWYGKKKYGYTPAFYGPSQDGLFADNLLSQSLNPLPIHFTIYEPAPIVSGELMNQFNNTQNIFAGSPSATIQFNGITIVPRQKK